MHGEYNVSKKYNTSAFCIIIVVCFGTRFGARVARIGTRVVSIGAAVVLRGRGSGAKVLGLVGTESTFQFFFLVVEELALWREGNTGITIATASEERYIREPL